MTRIAVFASGDGTNLQALIDAVKAGQIPGGEIVLVLSSKNTSRSLQRAKEAGIETVVLEPKGYPDHDAYSAALAKECQKRKVDLICLAGFMHMVTKPLVEPFRNRVINLHPALIPAFSGKGMWGGNVHEAVIKAGAKITGPTLHFVDEGLDTGPIIAQYPIPVLPDDTPQTLATRVRDVEHRAFPEVVRLFCEKRLRVEGRTVFVFPPELSPVKRKRRALVSVSDKAGVVDFCKALEKLGIEIVSTSGTAKALVEAGVSVLPLESVTEFPEFLGGRVKTLHPKVHGGILMRRKDINDLREAESLGVTPIDLVVVNLYPFAKTVAHASDPFSQAVIEQIDIGGVTLIRAAAKNYEDVAVIVSPDDYAAVLQELKERHGELQLETRRRLAVAAFRHTADYDAMIRDAWSLTPAPVTPAPINGAGAAGEENGMPADGSVKAGAAALAFPDTLHLELRKAQDLRYGENPHQKAALYVRDASGKTSFEQLHGKELSYNNLLDAAGAWEAVSDFEDPAVVIFKHVTPCGVGIGKTLFEAFERAWACDPLSAFGGIMAMNRPFTKNIAQSIEKRFMEVIVAPAYEPEALALLRNKQHLRILLQTRNPSTAMQWKTIGDEVLVTEPDRAVFGDEFKVVTKRKPTKDEEKAMRFAWTACKHVKSNAIVLCSPEATVGIGAGQMSRVDSVHMAGVKFKVYLKDNPMPKTLVVASDAFFPFRDGVDAAATLGISALICPGGSVRDPEVIAAANEHKLAMVFTGMRHFRH